MRLLNPDNLRRKVFCEDKILAVLEYAVFNILKVGLVNAVSWNTLTLY